MAIDKEYAVEFQRVLTAMSMLSAVEDSNYTKEHSLRVGRLVSQMTKILELPFDEQRMLVRTAYFHDVGKIKITKDILFKAGGLDSKEFEEIKEHPLHSKNIMNDLHLFIESEIAYKHHERLDGSGYPNGISGKDFEFDDQILAVADVYDALTADRPYRKGITAKESLLYLYFMAEKHFNLKIIQTLHVVLEKERKIKKTLDI